MGEPILYLSGPMTGYPEFNYPAFFRVEDRLASIGFQILNPARVDEQFPKPCGHLVKIDECPDCEQRDWRWYMRRAIAMMAEADGVAMLANWEQSRGARVEVQLAKDLGMPTDMWYDWLVEEAVRNPYIKSRIDSQSVHRGV